jgi:serine/threonine-protein kinase
LGEFFSHSSTDLDVFLQEKGFAYQGGAIDSTNSAIAEYTSYGQGTITFSSQPYKRYLSLPASSEENVLAAGVGISGVRLDTPNDMVPYGADRSDLINIAKTCGLKGAKQFCTNETITLPAGTHAITARFACLSGEYNGLTWTVLRISNGGIVRVAVTCAKSSIYNPADLAVCNGSVCQFVAYQEVYLSSEYWVVEKKETKKETKKDTKKTTKTTTKDTTDSSTTSDTSGN